MSGVVIRGNKEAMKYFENFLQRLRDHVEEGAAIEIASVAGTERIENWRTGVVEGGLNGTFTYTIQINGGARQTTGQPIGFPDVPGIHDA